MQFHPFSCFQKTGAVRPFFTFFFALVLIKNALSAQSGLQADYFRGRNFDEKKHSRIDRALDFDWRGKSPAPGLDDTEYSIRWTGKLTPPASGNYLFLTMVDDGIRVFIDGKVVVDAWGDHDSEDFTGKIYLEKGRAYDLKVEYFNGIFEGEMHLRWQMPGDEPMFGGLAGYNDKPIDGKYLSQPEKREPENVNAGTRPDSKAQTPALPKKPEKKKPTPAAKPRPAQGPSAQTAAVSRDTLKKYTPKNIQFVKSKPEMLPESLPELDNLLEMLRQYPTLKLTIEGHTDNIGDVAKNLELSEQRAQAVADYLIKNGIDAERLTSAGFGGARPIAPNETPSSRAKNRRVEFRF